jgi:peroxiredoxin family protein
MEDFKPNSHASKDIPAKKNIKQVTSGKAKIKRDPRKLADVFIAEDVSNVKTYLFLDVLVPAVKKLFVDMIETAVNMFAYGTNAPKQSSKAVKTSYSGYYNSSSSSRKDYRVSNSDSEYVSVLVDTRAEAEAAIFGCEELIDRYGMASIADFYDLVGITSKYTDYKYGWEDVKASTITRTREGYLIKMPKAKPLD